MPNASSKSLHRRLTTSSTHHLQPTHFSRIPTFSARCSYTYSSDARIHTSSRPNILLISPIPQSISRPSPAARVAYSRAAAARDSLTSGAARGRGMQTEDEADRNPGERNADPSCLAAQEISDARLWIDRPAAALIPARIRKSRSAQFLLGKEIDQDSVSRGRTLPRSINSCRRTLYMSVRRGLIHVRVRLCRYINAHTDIVRGVLADERPGELRAK